MRNWGASITRSRRRIANLAMRSTCFELMTRFYQRIGPAASPAQVLPEIGQVAHGFLDSGRLVLFSQDPDQPASIEPGEAGIWGGRAV